MDSGRSEPVRARMYSDLARISENSHNFYQSIVDEAIIRIPRSSNPKPFRHGASLRCDTPYKTEDDAALVRLAANDDYLAWEELFGRHIKKLLNFVKKRVNRLEDAEDIAEDVCQETFLRIFRHISEYNEKYEFSTWLHHIANNLIKNIYRDRSRKPTILLEYEDEKGLTSINKELIPECIKIGESIEDDLEYKTLQGIIDEGIKTLTPDHERALVLRDYQGLSYNQIAKRMNIKLGTTKSRLNRARDELRKYIEETGCFSGY